MAGIVDGWVEGVSRVVSANCGPRPVGVEPDLLVIHNISLPPGQFGGDCIERLFTNCLDWEAHPFFAEIRGLEVSSHFLIKRGGELAQFVSCDERAWHAGRSQYGGRTDCNDFSIGIELEGTDHQAYEEVQYSALVELTRTLMAHYHQLDAQRIVGHSDIAPGRKTDPGPAFNWHYFRLALAAGENGQ